MNVKLNTFVVYFSRIYAAIIGIMIIPKLLEYLGTSQYGLIGSFAVIQACLQILDAGIGGVLTREAIRSKNNIKSFHNFNVIFYKIVGVFIVISMILLVSGWFFSNNYALTFFNTNLPNGLITYCTFAMFVVFSLRYIQGPFRSILLAYEKHITLSIIDFIYVTISAPVALFLIIYFKGNIVTYFTVQILASIFKTLILIVFYSINTRKIKHSLKDSGDVLELKIKEIIKFAFQLSTLSVLWIMVNQSDKLILIKTMMLDDYAVYGIALNLLALISLFSGTMVQIIRPSLTKLYNINKLDEYSDLFKNAFGYFSCILVPLTLFILIYGDKLVFVWTNNYEVSIEIMKYLPYLFIGSFFSALSEFCFLLLYSHGNLRNHTIFYTIVSFIIIPLNVYVASNYLGDGSSKLYMLINIIIFITWSMYSINKYIKNSNIYIYCSIITYGIVSFLLFLFGHSYTLPEDRLLSFCVLLFLGGAAVICCLLVFKFILSKIKLEYRGVK